MDLPLLEVISTSEKYELVFFWYYFVFPSILFTEWICNKWIWYCPNMPFPFVLQNTETEVFYIESVCGRSVI